MKITAPFCLLLGLILSSAATPVVHAQLINPGFETGSFSGWNVSAGAQATVVGTVTDYPFDPFTLSEDFTRPYTAIPFAGSFQARLVAGTTPLPALETFLNLSAGLLSNVTTNPFGLADGAALFQTATLKAGDSILLHWNFLAVDSLFDDFAFAAVSGPGGSSFTMLQSVFGLNGSLGSGWQTLAFIAPAAGSYRVGFGVANTEDNTVSSILYADLAFVPVPEPSAYGLAAALSLVAVVVFRRRSRDRLAGT